MQIPSNYCKIHEEDLENHHDDTHEIDCDYEEYNFNRNEGYDRIMTQQHQPEVNIDFDNPMMRFIDISNRQEIIISQLSISIDGERYPIHIFPREEGDPFHFSFERNNGDEYVGIQRTERIEFALPMTLFIFKVKKKCIAVKQFVNFMNENESKQEDQKFGVFVWGSVGKGKKFHDFENVEIRENFLKRLDCNSSIRQLVLPKNRKKGTIYKNGSGSFYRLKNNEFSDHLFSIHRNSGNSWYWIYNTEQKMYRTYKTSSNIQIFQQQQQHQLLSLKTFNPSPIYRTLSGRMSIKGENWEKQPRDY